MDGLYLDNDYFQFYLTLQFSNCKQNPQKNCTVGTSSSSPSAGREYKHLIEYMLMYAFNFHTAAIKSFCKLLTKSWSRPNNLSTVFVAVTYIHSKPKITPPRGVLQLNEIDAENVLLALSVCLVQRTLKQQLASALAEIQCVSIDWKVRNSASQILWRNQKQLIAFIGVAK